MIVKRSASGYGATANSLLAAIERHGLTVFDGSTTLRPPTKGRGWSWTASRSCCSATCARGRR